MKSSRLLVEQTEGCPGILAACVDLYSRADIKGIAYVILATTILAHGICEPILI